MVAVICNNYVSGQYDNAIGEMISINNLENSVEVLNGDINMAYLYLSEEGTENYEQDRKSAEQYLKMVKELQKKSFVREVTDAYCTVESFLGKSDFHDKMLCEDILKAISRQDLKNWKTATMSFRSFILTLPFVFRKHIR